MATTTQRGGRTAPEKRRARERIFCCTLSWRGTVIDFSSEMTEFQKSQLFLKVEESMELTGCVAKVVRFGRRVVRSPCACARKCNARGSCLCGGVRTYECCAETLTSDINQSERFDNTVSLTARDDVLLRQTHHCNPHVKSTPCGLVQTLTNRNCTSLSRTRFLLASSE